MPLTPKPLTLTCSLHKFPVIFMPPNSLHYIFSNIYFGFCNLNQTQFKSKLCFPHKWKTSITCHNEKLSRKKKNIVKIFFILFFN